MNAIAAYRDQAVSFAPGRLRVGRTPLTCRVAVDVLNALRAVEESDTAYRLVNVHNPRCPLRYDRVARQWGCEPVLLDHPVWGINWAGAVLVCEALGARLPRAAEWERFASNDDPGRIYPWGNGAPSPLLANYDEHYGGPLPVGRFAPSEIGLIDLAGNIGEWCADRVGGFERVVKGGAWSKDAHWLAIAASRGKWQRLGTTTIGLRPVWDDGIR